MLLLLHYFYTIFHLLFSVPFFLYIQVAATIRTFAGISGSRLKTGAAVWTGCGNKLNLLRADRLVIHKLILPRENLIPDRIRVIAEFAPILKDVDGHSDWVFSGTSCDSRRKDYLPLHMVFIKIVHLDIEREGSIQRIRRIVHIAVNLGCISMPPFCYFLLFADADKHGCDKCNSQYDKQKRNRSPTIPSKIHPYGNFHCQALLQSAETSHTHPGTQYPSHIYHCPQDSPDHRHF